MGFFLGFVVKREWEWEEAEKYLRGYTGLDDNRYSKMTYFSMRKNKYDEALGRWCPGWKMYSYPGKRCLLNLENIRASGMKRPRHPLIIEVEIFERAASAVFKRLKSMVHHFKGNNIPVNRLPGNIYLSNTPVVNLIQGSTVKSMISIWEIILCFMLEQTLVRSLFGIWSRRIRLSSEILKYGLLPTALLVCRRFSCGTNIEGKSFLVEWPAKNGYVKHEYYGLGNTSVGVVQFDTIGNRFLAAGDKFLI